MIKSWILAALLLLLPTIALAQGHGHSHHGGQEVKIGKYEAELVVKGTSVTLYLNDANDKQIDSSGFSATAVILAKGNQQKTIELKPAGENKLAGAFDFQVDAKFRATVTLKSSAGEVGKGRYNLDMPR
jgi:hypothetical protein